MRRFIYHFNGSTTRVNTTCINDDTDRSEIAFAFRCEYKSRKTARNWFRIVV